MSELPSGTVTFLFTDIEGSARLWEAHPDAMQGALARHDATQASSAEGTPRMFTDWRLQAAHQARMRALVMLSCRVAVGAVLALAVVPKCVRGSVGTCWAAYERA